jgi:hypothetical protein
MTMDTKNDIFAEHLPAWLKAKGNKKKRGEIASHIVFVTKMHPKSVPRKFNRLQLQDPAHQDRRGRVRYYDAAFDAALETIWKAADEPCGELLHPVIGEYLKFLKDDASWRHDNAATKKLLAASERTIKRRVSGFLKIRRRKGGMTSTSPSLIKHIIPIFKGPWNELPPGNGQLDTVAHCGETLAGSFVYTVNYTDTATYWVIPRAQWNKGQEETLKSMDVIVEKCPFPISMMHPDSGSEFINWHAERWSSGTGIRLTRSEPYRKNDNMYVEERNGHVVRRYLGYERLDVQEVVPFVNELYDVVVLYHNYFKPVRRMIGKERVGARYRRTYEKIAKTPYQRTLEHPAISETIKKRLRNEREALNPIVLKRKIDVLRKKIYDVQKAARNREIQS